MRRFLSAIDAAKASELKRLVVSQLDGQDDPRSFQLSCPLKSPRAFYERTWRHQLVAPRKYGPMQASNMARALG